MISNGEITKPSRIFFHAFVTQIALCSAFDNKVRILVIFTNVSQPLNETFWNSSGIL